VAINRLFSDTARAGVRLFSVINLHDDNAGIKLRIINNNARFEDCITELFLAGLVIVI